MQEFGISGVLKCLQTFPEVDNKDVFTELST